MKTLYGKFEAKYFQYCEENEQHMEEYYESYVDAYRCRVIEPASKRIEAIMTRLGYSADAFWSIYEQGCCGING